MFLDGIFSIGVMGDFKNNGVQFFMPNLVSDDYFGKLLNYDEGIKKFRGIKKIGQLVSHRTETVIVLLEKMLLTIYATLHGCDVSGLR